MLIPGNIQKPSPRGGGADAILVQFSPSPCDQSHSRTSGTYLLPLLRTPPDHTSTESFLLRGPISMNESFHGHRLSKEKRLTEPIPAKFHKHHLFELLAYYLQVPLFYLSKVVAPVQRFPVRDISHEEHLKAILMDLATRPKTCYQIQGGGIFNYISNSTTTNNYFVGLC
ncbi:BICD1: BICD cargo adaptor 1 [Crotalus adamanteus]|uniref:BICD1: BICD cargo adaptor 1 n=1 Tax=Crotalus adamanteus TaxID=8729 RepID=A0AAW1BDL3_CROAD